MNINEKQRLWSKYYLTHSGRKNNMVALLMFLEKEVELFGLYKQNIQEKKKKLFKYMLRTLNKKSILQNYCRNYPHCKKMTKNEIIDFISKYI